MMLALAFALTWLGLAALALAMDRHAALLPTPLAAVRRALRGLGAAALMASLLCTRACLDFVPALATWLGLLAPATLCTAAVLSWLQRPRRQSVRVRSAAVSASHSRRQNQSH